MTILVSHQVVVPHILQQNCAHGVNNSPMVSIGKFGLFVLFALRCVGPRSSATSPHATPEREALRMERALGITFI